MWCVQHMHLLKNIAITKLFQKPVVLSHLKSNYAPKQESYIDCGKFKWCILHLFFCALLFRQNPGDSHLLPGDIFSGSKSWSLLDDPGAITCMLVGLKKSLEMEVFEPFRMLCIFRVDKCDQMSGCNISGCYTHCGGVLKMAYWIFQRFYYAIIG